MIEIIHRDMINTAATLEAYNSIFRTNGIQQRDSFYLWLLHILNPNRKGILLDISCGQGRLVKLAKESGMNAIGMDFSHKAVSIANNNSTNNVFAVADGERLPLDDASIEFITHIGSLEHYVHPNSGAKEICRVLKPGGMACILLPNAFGIFGNIRYVAAHGEVFDDGQPIQRYATKKTWSNLLTHSGLSVLKVYAYHEVDFPRTQKDYLWLLLRPMKVVRGLLASLIPVNLANHLVFLCTRDPRFI